MNRNRILELSLLYMYLAGWEECSRNNSFKKRYVAWTCYPYHIMDFLQKENYIYQPLKQRQGIITPEGIDKAKELDKNGILNEEKDIKRMMNLLLVLVYYTCEEKEVPGKPGEKKYYFSRGYSQDVLDELKNLGLITDHVKLKVKFTAQGIEYAKQLIQKMK